MLKAGTAARRWTLRAARPLEADAVQRGVEHFLHRLDLRIQEREPHWVGHCKLLVSSERGTAYASTTGADEPPTWAGTPVGVAAAELTIYVAIYGWSDADVALVLDSLLREEPILAAPDAIPR